MAGEDNMVSSSKPAVPLGSDDSISVLSTIYRFFKKVSIVGAVYLVGYMQWSAAWLLGPVVLSVLRDQWRKESEYRRSLAKIAARSSEKEFVLARVDELPAWVFFPDVERAEWLNRILQQVWPNVNHYARTLLKDTIGPAVAESLANFKLKGFQFERMILGTIAPRVSGVKVYDNKNLARDEIIMDIDLFYAGDCDISFVVQGIRGGIKDMQLHGMIRVVLKPLISRMPLIGGLQVFFLNNPDINFNLVGAADVLDMPGLSDILRRCIVEQIANMMVLPNKLPIKLSDEIPTVDLRMPDPEGVLRIHLVQAQNLMKKDITMLGKGKSDPYARIVVGAQTWTTKHINNNLNPRWDYWCEAIISSKKSQKLQCELKDWDGGVGNDDPLGRCCVDISQVVRTGRTDEWYTLQEAKHGRVQMRLSWHRLTTDASELKRALLENQIHKDQELSSAVLSVYVDSCKSLPDARAGSRPDPYLTITVGKKTQNTGIQMRTGDPVYEVGHSFLVQNPEIDTLEIKVIDQKTNTKLGQLSYAIGLLLKQKDMSMLVQPIMLLKSGPESRIILSAQLRILKEAVREETEEEEAPSTPPPTPVAPAPPAAPPAPADALDGAAPPAPAVAPEQAAPVSDNVNGGPDNASQKSIPVEQITKEVDVPQESQAQTGRSSPKLVHRASTLTTSAGEAGLGRIRLTLRYSKPAQVLYIVVHKIMNIPLKDPTNIPDPYVKLYLLPGRSKESKRKTVVVKDSCMPEFDEKFEWGIPLAELHSRQVEVTVATHKGFLGGSPIIGQVIVHLNQYDFVEAKSLWFDLMPENPRE